MTFSPLPHPQLCTSPLFAQGSGFSTPGMPGSAATGQTDRFSNEFNPAIGGALDFLLTALDGDGEDGLKLDLRALELSVNTWIDPNTWAYGVLVGQPEDGVSLEEAAVVYQGFGGHSTLRAGRFFVDFGKQMQAHEHDLPTFERPAVLRGYLGEELGGTGVQYDNWFAAGDAGAVRFSLGLFQNLANAHDHGHGDAEESATEILIADYKDAQDLSYTGRLTGFHDAGENGVLQWGLSVRGIPSFAFESTLSDGTVLGSEELANHVFGADLTYGWNDDTGLKGWTVGGEYLVFQGDIGAEVDDNGTPANFADDTLQVLDSNRSGYYLWAQHAWDQYHSAGLLYSEFEHAEAGSPKDSEIVAWYSRNLTEMSRLRFGVRYADSDESGDSTALLVQFTNFFGSHAHGVNW